MKRNFEKKSKKRENYLEKPEKCTALLEPVFEQNWSRSRNLSWSRKKIERDTRKIHDLGGEAENKTFEKSEFLEAKAKIGQK